LVVAAILLAMACVEVYSSSWHSPIFSRSWPSLNFSSKHRSTPVMFHPSSSDFLLLSEIVRLVKGLGLFWTSLRRVGQGPFLRDLLPPPFPPFLLAFATSADGFCFSLIHFFQFLGNEKPAIGPFQFPSPLPSSQALLPVLLVVNCPATTPFNPLPPPRPGTTIEA